jgi:hypothetical protein
MPQQQTSLVYSLFSCVRYALFGKKAVIWFILNSTFSIIQGHEG